MTQSEMDAVWIRLKRAVERFDREREAIKIRKLSRKEEGRILREGERIVMSNGRPVLIRKGDRNVHNRSL